MTRVITEIINPTLPDEQQITIPAHLVDKSKFLDLLISLSNRLGEESQSRV